MATAVETRRDVEAASEAVSRPRLPGLLLRIGLGGFVDGIVLHQILQWHHMLTSEGDYPKTTVAGLETNTLWDGLFHAVAWIAVAVGVGFSGGAPRTGDRLSAAEPFSGGCCSAGACSTLLKGSSITKSSRSTTSAKAPTTHGSTTAVSSPSARCSSSPAGSSPAPQKPVSSNALSPNIACQPPH